MTPQTTTKPPSHFTTLRDDAMRRAEEIRALDYVTDVRVLPDVHFKDGMEAPSSVVIASKGRIIPHLVSESINDGMGLVKTDLSIDDVDDSQLDAFLAFMNREGARSKLRPNNYSWTSEQLEAMCLEGASAAISHYDLPARFLDAVEDRGRAPGYDFDRDDYRRLVPGYLRRTRLTRSEIGLNFGGNHFVELQAVDRITDPRQADAWGLREGQLLVMYHLGPGPLGSMLSNLHAYRQKPQIHRKLGYAVFRGLLHGARGRERYEAFVRLNKWNAIAEDTAAGERLADVLALIKNYGFAYRMGTVAAIVDGIGHAFGVERDSTDLVVDMSHNILQPEEYGGERRWVSRHNCCRPIEGFPGIVAGNHQVSSYLTVGPPGAGNEIGGYDHGCGFLLQMAAANDETDPDERGLAVRRLRMKRGRSEITEREVLPLLDSAVVDAAVDELAAARQTAPVATLRPLATLKHII